MELKRGHPALVVRQAHHEGSETKVVGAIHLRNLMVSLSNHEVSGAGRAMHLWVYILRCSDGSYYVGSTKKEPEGRVWEHNERLVPGYTHSRTPVTLVHAERYDRLLEGFAREQQLKRWSRAKKQALIEERMDDLLRLARSKPSPG